MHPRMGPLPGARRKVEESRTSAFPSAATIRVEHTSGRDAMSTYSQDGFTPDPGTPVYEDISVETTTTGGTTGGKKDTAKQEAAGVAQDATQAGRQVADTAVDQGKQVAGTAKEQARR